MLELGVRTTSEVLLSEAMKKEEERIEKERCGLGGGEKKHLNELIWLWYHVGEYNFN